MATVDVSTAFVRAKADSGECTITATLADGTESIQCLVRVGDITVPIFATGSWRASGPTTTSAWSMWPR